MYGKSGTSSQAGCKYPAEADRFHFLGMLRKLGREHMMRPLRAPALSLPPFLLVRTCYQLGNMTPPPAVPSSSQGLANIDTQVDI